jgi:hypothetical protein
VKTAEKIASLTIFSSLIFSSARADWRFDAETGAFYNSNLSNSDRAADEENDWAWKSEVRAANGLQLSRDLRLEISGDLGGHVWSEYDGFDSVTGGASAGLRYRFGLGPSAPWILAEDRLAYAWFNENERSGWQETVRVRGGMKVADRISAEGSYIFDHFAAPGRFFDVAGHTGAIRLTVDVTPALQVAVGYAYRDGDVISYAVPPRPDIASLASDKRPVQTFDELYIGYRLPGSSNSLSVWAAYSVTKFASCQVGYEFVDTWHAPLGYVNHLVEVKVAIAY